MAGAGERRPVLLATVGIVVILAITLVAFNFEALFTGGTTYEAEFTEAAGLQAEDQVTVAGVEVGRVKSVELERDHVLVTFNVSDAWIGNRTTGSIEIRTLLGSKFLALDPRGDAEQDPATSSPRDRTKSPFDVVDAFNGLSGTIDQLDTQQLAHQPADALGHVPEHAEGGPRHAGRTVPAVPDDLQPGRAAEVAAGRDAPAVHDAGQPARGRRQADQRRQPAAR